MRKPRGTGLLRLESGRVLLKELSASDMPAVNRWRNDPELVSHLASPYRFVNAETDRDWFESYQRSRSTQVRCCIWTLRRPHRRVGLVSLTGIDPVHRSAEFHVMIGEDRDRGAGLGTEATRLMLDHAFFNLNLHRVYLTVLEENRRAVAVYRKLGFKREGVLRQAAFKQGAYKDLVLFSVLRFDPIRRRIAVQ